MALKDFSSAESIQRSRRGTINPNLGGKTVVPTTDARENKGFVGGFTDKVGAIAKQAGSITSKGLYNTGKFVVNTPKYVYEDVRPFLNATAKVVTGNLNAETKQIESQRLQLDDQLDRFTKAYKNGEMNKQNYNTFLKEYGSEMQRLGKGSQEVEQQLNQETHDAMVSAAMTAATVLLGSRLTLTKAPNAAIRRTAAYSATQAGKQKVLASIVEKNATNLEKAIMKVPAVRDLVHRNVAYLGRREAQQLAGESLAQYTAREGKAIAVNFLLKRPIVYQMNVEGAEDVYNDLMSGDYGDAVKTAGWMSTQLLSGGPLGAAAKGFKWLNKTTGKLSYGSGSVIDSMSRQMGNGDPYQIAKYLQYAEKTNVDEFKRAERTYRIAQETNLQMANGNAEEAANRILQHWHDAGIDLREVTPKKAFELLENWSIAHELKNTLIKGGKIPGIKPSDAGKYVVVRWDVDARNALANKFASAEPNAQSLQEVYDTWRLAPGNQAGQNHLLTQKIEAIINGAFKSNPDAPIAKIVEDIKDISAVSVMPKNLPASVKKQFAKLGFSIAQPFKGAEKITPAVNYDDTRKLISAVQKGDTEIFDVATAPQPQLSLFARTLERFGISPVAATQEANRALSQQVVSHLDELNVAKNLGFSAAKEADTITAGRVILSKLQDYVEKLQPSRTGQLFVAGTAPASAVSDIRQLTVREIRDALGKTISDADAKAVKRSIIDGYSKVPMEFRGLGDKIVDNLYKYNPLHSGYARAQGAMRYTYNPFFRTQESVETRLLSRAQARDVMWRKPDDYIGTTREYLNEAAQKLDEAGIFTTGLSGEAAQDLVLGRITANITKGQKRQLAGLATAMARSKGISLDQMLAQHSDEVGDALRVIVQYPNKGVLNSSLARTLNVAFFPMRYNAKVTALAASVLSKEPPTVQMAVLNSVFNFKDWLQSDEGIQWQADNADAIQVLNWVTPLGSIDYVLKKLTKQPDAIGELGSLGGLPLGIISQMLDSQGIITLNTPYVDPKTGDIVPKYIPETDKARAATAVGDVLNSMFTYPGRVLGLPGKQQTINKVTRAFIDTNGTEFEKRIDEERLTPLQRRMIEVLKGDDSDEAVDALYRSPADGQFDWYTLPSLDLPIRDDSIAPPEVTRRTDLPTKKQLSDAKKAAKKVKPTAKPIS